jgi:hypothetical protein
MPLQVECTCGAFVRMNPALAGKKVRCPSCKAVLSVPASSAVSKRPMPPPLPKRKVAEPEQDDDDFDEESSSPLPKKKKNSNQVVVRYKTNTQYVLPMFMSMGGVGGITAAALIFKDRANAPISILLLILVLGTAIGIALLGVFLFPKNTRLVIGSQYVELLSRTGSLLGQIPIRNIAGLAATRKVEYYQTSHGQRERIYFVVEVRPVKRRDDDTYWPEWNREPGESIEIFDEYEKSLTWIRGRIQTRVDRHRESH